MSHSRKASAAVATVIAAPSLSDGVRAKRIGGDKIRAASYPNARVAVAAMLRRAVVEHGLSEERMAEAAGVSRSLIHAYLDPESPQKPRLDLLVCIAEHGGADARGAVEQLLGEVLELVKTGRLSLVERGQLALKW